MTADAEASAASRRRGRAIPAMSIARYPTPIKAHAGPSGDSGAAGTRVALLFASARMVDPEGRMLKVTIVKDEEATRLVVEGRLVEPEASELLRAWLGARAADPSASIEVDLSGVGYADQAAIELLATMNRRGVRLIGRGAMTRSLIDRATDGAGPRGGAS